MGCVDVDPGFDNGSDLIGGHVCKGEVVGGREADDIAFSSDGLGAEQAGGQGSIFLVGVVLFLLFFDGTVVVDKDKRVFEFGIVLAICPGVAGA
jgi:hypothetical protein